MININNLYDEKLVYFVFRFNEKDLEDGGLVGMFTIPVRNKKPRPLATIEDVRQDDDADSFLRQGWLIVREGVYHYVNGEYVKVTE